MSVANNQFRVMSFGGFNREDVLNYLANTAQEHEGEVSQLRSELNRYQSELAEASKQLAELSQRLQDLERQEKSLQESLSRMQGEREQADSKLGQCENELTQLRSEISELRPKALAYDKLRERAAGIELDAHERAQQTIDQARREALRLQQDYVAFINQAKSQYEQLQTGLGTAFAKSSDELHQLLSLYARVQSEFSDSDQQMAELVDRASSLACALADEPVPC